MRELEFHAPSTLQEAVAILERHDGQARCLAGGTDLIAQLKESGQSASVIVDVKHISEVTALSYQPAAGLRLGAALSCTANLNHPPSASAGRSRSSGVAVPVSRAPS